MTMNEVINREFDCQVDAEFVLRKLAKGRISGYLASTRLRQIGRTGAVYLTRLTVLVNEDGSIGSIVSRNRSGAMKLGTPYVSANYNAAQSL